MADFECKDYKVDDNVTLSVDNGTISILIRGLNRHAFVDYSEALFELMKDARFRVPIGEQKIRDYKYLYSNKYKKHLHKVVFDHYFGEQFRTKAYSLGYIIEHLDNDGYNCRISNLFVLKKVKNTYKGWNFDKLARDSLQVVSLKMYHDIDKKTFQVVIFFNQSFVNSSENRRLQSVKLLYEYDYEIVLQDSEQILESIVQSGNISFDEWRKRYRYNDIRIAYAPEIELTEDERRQGPGTYIWRNGEFYILIGSAHGSCCFVNSIGKDDDWGLK